LNSRRIEGRATLTIVLSSPTISRLAADGEDEVPSPTAGLRHAYLADLMWLLICN